MRLRFLPLLLALLMALPALARDFTYTYEGQTITYTVLDETAKTVETKQGEGSDAGNKVSGDLVLPAHPMDGDVEYTLIAIGEDAFHGNSALKNVVIPNTVTTIEGLAFFGCSALTRVEIPSSVTTISLSPFGDCGELTEINVDSGNQYYSSEDGVLFNYDKTILVGFPPGRGGAYSIPNSVTTIGYDAFWYNNVLTNVEIPNSVTVIEGSAFEACTALTNVVIPNSVTTIEASAFSLCSALTSITISNSITKIETGTFSGCVVLTDIEIPNSVTSIEDFAFRRCFALSNIVIPKSVTTIGNDVFDSCFMLKEINVDSENQYYSSEDGVLFNYDKTVLVQCPLGKEEEYSIPSSVKTIGNSAFKNCQKLYYLEIPSSVTEIGNSAFFNCNFLSVTCLATVPPTLPSDAFTKRENSYLYVPAASVSAYENSDWAQYFTGIKSKDSIGLTVNIIGNGKVYDNSLNAVESGSVFGDSELSFLIIPEAGNRIEAITMDGEDAMDKLTGNKLTVRREAPESVLNIEFAPESEATLTVKAGDSYAATYTYTAGTAAVVKIQPESGWKVSTVTYNGADVTDQLESNVYVTAPLEGENSLFFVLEKKNPTGVDEVSAPGSGVRVSVLQNMVTITGLEPGAQVSVHDVAGNMVYAGNEHSLTLPAGQAYIISTPSKTFKVAL